MRIIDYQHALKFITEKEIAAMEGETLSAKSKLVNRTGPGSDFTGWVDYPLAGEENIKKITAAARRIRENSEVLLVIGIGGSYLGAKAGLELLNPYFGKQGGPEILFAGHTLSSSYTRELIDYLQGKNFSVNVISKSGTTTEPAIAFRIFKKLLEEKYGEEARERIYVTTTIGKGALYGIAVENGYKMVGISEDIGGRYSVLTPVGLLPFAVAGIDVGAILEGAASAREDALTKPYLENDALLYAALRNLFYRRGKTVELLASYEPKLRYFGEWYKQLFGESEGKDGKGLFPASVLYTTDLHSLGQYVQDGERILFETVINFEKPEKDMVLIREEEDFDGLNYLAGKSLDYVNRQALKGTVLAHVDGDVPNLLLNFPEISARQFGRMVYFFMFACGVSGYLLGVNPFNQEGVEAYKRNMFTLLGKP